MKFASVKEAIDFHVKNKKELILLKKSNVKHTEPFGVTDLQASANKALSTNYADDVASGVIKRTIIGNTYNWMDSQSDALLPGVFSKSINERISQVLHLHDHIREVSAKVGKPENIYEKSVAWADLGIDLPGNTEALFMDSNIMKDLNPSIFQQYLLKDINQHSVGMQYVNLELAVNDPEYKMEFAIWNNYINQIGNKDKVEEQGFFWAVKEGKLLEVSAVLAGANELTPTLDNKMKELLDANSGNKNFYSNLAEYIRKHGLVA